MTDTTGIGKGTVSTKGFVTSKRRYRVQQTPEPVAVTIDSKGRVVLPKEVRVNLGVKPGDVMMLQQNGAVLRLAKPINPFDVLARRAVEQYRRGENITLDAWAKGQGVDLDEVDNEDE